MASAQGRVVAALAGGLVGGLVLGFVAGWGLRDDAPHADDSVRDPGAASGPAAPSGVAPESSSSSAARGAADSRTPRTRGRADDAGRATSAGAAAGPSRAATSPGDASDAASGGRGTADGPGADRASAMREGRPAAVRDAAARDAAAQPSPGGPALRDAQGVVVDAVTQQPIEGARVLYAFLTGRSAGGWTGDTTGADGRFRYHVADEAELVGATAEIRVSKDGYETARVAPAPGEMRIELRVRGVALLPGRVAGTVRDADGKPVAGEVEIDGYDETGGNASQRTVADAAGAFVLEGVPAGVWRMSWAQGPAAEVAVPDGGEARVELRARRPGDRPGLVVTDVDPSKVDAGPAAAELRELLALLGRVEGAADLAPGARERLRLALAQEVQRLAASAGATLPRREVVVTGLAAGGRAWLRLELKPRQFWRVEVQDGAARFPPVAVGAYTAVLVEPGRPDRTATVVVAPGDGRLDAPWVEDAPR